MFNIIINSKLYYRNPNGKTNHSLTLFVDSLHFAAEPSGQDAFVPLVCRVQRIREEENRDRGASVDRAEGIQTHQFSRGRWR